MFLNESLANRIAFKFIRITRYDFLNFLFYSKSRSGSKCGAITVTSMYFFLSLKCIYQLLSQHDGFNCFCIACNSNIVSWKVLVMTISTAKK